MFSYISDDKARPTFRGLVSKFFECNPQFFCSFNLHKCTHIRDDHGSGVDSGRSLHFRLEQESESIF